MNFVEVDQAFARRAAGDLMKSGDEDFVGRCSRHGKGGVWCAWLAPVI